MGFDVIHMNLHKTFSTPRRRRAQVPVKWGVSARLEPLSARPHGRLRRRRLLWLTERDRPHSIGQLTAFGGNMGILLRAYIYARMLGAEGMRRVGEYATLNANYLMARLTEAGFEAAYPERSRQP